MSAASNGSRATAAKSSATAPRSRLSDCVLPDPLGPERIVMRSSPRRAMSWLRWPNRPLIRSRLGLTAMSACERKQVHGPKIALLAAAVVLLICRAARPTLVSVSFAVVPRRTLLGPHTPQRPPRASTNPVDLSGMGIGPPAVSPAPIPLPSTFPSHPWSNGRTRQGVVSHLTSPCVSAALRRCFRTP